MFLYKIYTDILTFLSELSTIQLIAMIFTCTMSSIAIWSILTYITTRLVDSVKDQNKTLLDNMNRLDTKQNNNRKLTK